MVTAPFLTLAPGGRAPDDVWWLNADDGVRLRAACWRAEDPVGHAVLLSGRTEYLEKMTIPAGDLLARGLSVVSLDWRGQGLSDRLVEPAMKGHVGDFAEFQRDLDALLDEPRTVALPGPRLLIAHSMGGAIAAAAMARPEIAGTVAATVLSAPMFGIAMGPAMRLAARVATRIGLALGMGDRWPPFGDSATPYVLQGAGADDNVLTGDPNVWAWMVAVAQTHPELCIATPTLGWFGAARRETRRLARLDALGGPVLCLRGSAEQVVDPRAIGRAAERLGLELADIPGGRHEVLIDTAPVRRAAWAVIDAFLAEQGYPVRPSGG